MISPGEWGNLIASNYCEGLGDLNGSFFFHTCRHMGDGIYNYRFLGAKEQVDNFNPDWLYVQAEPGSIVASEAIKWKAKKRAIFTWENIGLKGGEVDLPMYDLVVCGNPEAIELVRPFNPKTHLMLQVGLNADHLCARPDVPRDIKVAYIGRKAAEKGLPYLLQAWPTVKIMDWVNYSEIPWVYSQVDVVVAYSQDVPYWREQAPNYIVLEALLCGCKAVVSDTAASRYWLGGCPGVVETPGHKQEGPHLDLLRINCLRDDIKWLLDVDVQEFGREWVKGRFSNQVMAKELVEVLRNA